MERLILATLFFCFVFGVKTFCELPTRHATAKNIESIVLSINAKNTPKVLKTNTDQLVANSY